MAGVIGLRGPDIDRRDALRGYKVEWHDADRPIIRPHTGVPTLRLVDGEPVVERHVFGFTTRFSSFNARDDKLESGKMWSRYFGRSHGVTPVSYILEWADLGSGKQPWRIERADGAAMAVPSLVGSYWEDRDQRACALITTEPNPFIRRVHPRVIAQLDDDAIDAWLRPDEHTVDELRACISGGSADDFVAHPLDASVGSAKFDDAGALESVGEPVSWANIAGDDDREGGATQRQTRLDT